MKKFISSFLISIIIFTLLFLGVSRFILDNNSYKADGEIAESKIDGEILVLFLGVDSDDLMAETGNRTDTMILGKADFDTGKIEMLSIPRDTRVIVNGREDKINHAHSYGGTNLAIQTVEDFLNLDIDYYVKVDFKGIQQIVDSIGGVEIEVKDRMYYSDPTATPPLLIDLQPGLQKLNGEQAHGFLRFRSYSEGDLKRVENQQYFMKELAKQMLRPRNLLRLDKIIKVYYNYVDTNIPLSTMLKYGLQSTKLNVDEMRTETVPGSYATIGGGSYWIYDPYSTNQLVEEMFSPYRH